MIPLPYTLIGLVAALVLLVGGAALGVKSIYARGYAAAEADCKAKGEAQAKAMQQALADVSRDYEALRQKADKVRTERTNTVREIYREVPAPPIECAPDPRALRLLDAAISDANP
jgi:uncharacterized membrane protein